jgi:hypothetical protein
VETEDFMVEVVEAEDAKEHKMEFLLLVMVGMERKASSL